MSDEHDPGRDIETVHDPDPDRDLPDPLADQPPLDRDPGPGDLPSDPDVQAERQP